MDVYKEDNLKLAYLRILKKYIEESDLKLIAYCIMGTHSHLLFKVERVKDLIKCMSKLNTTFAKYYNKIYGRVGYVCLFSTLISFLCHCLRCVHRIFLITS